MSQSTPEERRERAAAVQAAQARAERNRKVALYGAVIAVVAIIAAAVFWYSGGSGGSTASNGMHYGSVPARIVSLQGAPAKTVTSSTATGGAAPGLVIGKPSAPVKVVVYEDFLCPYCHELEESTRDFLHDAADKGKVEVEYRPFHLLPEQYSTDALNGYFGALQSSSPTSVLKFHDLIYDNQPYETASSFPDAAKIASWAKTSGADASKVEAAVTAADPAYEKAMDALASSAGVDSTPTVYVNGQMLKGASISDMADNLENLINAS